MQLHSLHIYANSINLSTEPERLWRLRGLEKGEAGAEAEGEGGRGGSVALGSDHLPEIFLP